MNGTLTPETTDKQTRSEYSLRISPDKLSVLLDHPDPHADLESLVNRILIDFEPLELTETPDEAQLTEILTQACGPDEPLCEYAIIRGRPVVPPQEGHLDWARDFFTDGWQIDDDTDTINFWEKLERRAVHDDELLVRLVHPIPGVPGLNVLGAEIPVAKPSKLKLRCGKGVRQVEEEGAIAFHADCNGRVRNADGTVSVDDVYTVRGNVSLETGNIRHTGTVVIEGDVTAGATVDSEGDIIVKGMIETCHIRCGGSLTVAGGILGSPEYPMEIEGSLEAKYISEAWITVGGNVTVTNEIAHARIRSGGRVDVPTGRIAGGEVIALQGIRMKEAGASGSTRTLLASGVDHQLKERLRPHRQKIRKLEEAQTKIAQLVAKAQRNPNGLTEAGRQALSDLSLKAVEAGKALAREKETVATLTSEIATGAVMEIVVMSEVWSGTTIQLGEFKLEIRVSVRKPRIAVLRKKKVRILPLGDGNMPAE